MRDIAKLLFGREGDILSGLFAPGESDEFSLAEQARRAGEWCGTTPGRGSAAGLLRAAAGGRAGGRAGGTARAREAGRAARRGR
jgi:hypothetical protein